MSKQSKPTEYTAEFKESAVKLATQSDQPVARTAEELGINKNTLYNWVGKYQQSKPKGSGRDDEHVYDELKRLRRENKRLMEERDILKKAAAYFAKESL